MSGFGVKRKVIDWLDSFYLKMSKKGLPPYSLRAYVGRPGDFERVPQEFIAYFKLLGGLKMDQTVLDIGCGPGRFASELIRVPHFFHGAYYGFDIHKRAINWANTNIAQCHKNCRFDLVDLKNTHYNPHGRLNAETFSFPYEKEKFDFIFAVSVFTHLLPKTTSNYLQQIHRVLKPDGTALLSFLILDGLQESLSSIAKKTLGDLILHLGSSDKWHHYEKYSVISPENPEAIIVYQEKAVIEMIEKSRLEVEEIYRGSWNQGEDYLSFQDVIIIRKP